jgi:uncharacterized protein
MLEGCKLRREEKRIKDEVLIDSILQEAEYCMISLSDNGRPYILPMNFGFKDYKLYLHSHHEGKKMEILKVNNRISFAVTIKTELLKSDKPCKWGMRYMSVAGYGLANLLGDKKHKVKALDIIMDKYSDRRNGFGNYEYDESAIKATSIIMVDIESLTGKISGFEM